MKTSELTGAALDWAVACVEKLPMDLLIWEYGLPVVKRTILGHTDTLRCEFSTNWAQGGPIIERECITVECQFDRVGWKAWTPAPEQPDGEAVGAGDTALIAAMRCFVAAHLGDEVDVPEELK